MTALKAFSEADVRRDPYQPLPLELALASIVYGPPPAPASSSPPSQPGQPRQQGQQRQQRQQRPDSQRRQPQRREQQATRNLPDRTTEAQQPTPTTEPVSEVAAGQGLLDQIVGTLMRRDRVLAAAVRDGCQSARTVDKGLRLEFSANREGYMKRCQDALPLLSEVAEHVLKRPAQVDCVLSSQPDGPTGGAGAAGGPEAKPSAQTGRSRLAEEAKSRFGARPFQSN